METPCLAFRRRARCIGNGKRVTEKAKSACCSDNCRKPSCKSSARTNGAVAYRQQACSPCQPCCRIWPTAWAITAPVVAKSSASSAGRTNGTSAPYCRAICAISSSSVDTIICSKQPALWAARMLWAIMGLPLNGRMFLRGMRLLPPRAGMIHRVIKASVVGKKETVIVAYGKQPAPLESAGCFLEQGCEKGVIGS